MTDIFTLSAAVGYDLIKMAGYV